MKWQGLSRSPMKARSDGRRTKSSLYPPATLQDRNTADFVSKHGRVEIIFTVQRRSV